MLVMLASVAIATVANVSANGRVLTYDTRTAGPYEVAVGKIPETPTVGELHLTMTITEIATALVIRDADVVITAIGPDSSEIEIGPLNATSELQVLIEEPTYYDIVTEVDRIGTWVFTINVTSEVGSGSADFPVEVREANPITGIATLIALLAFVVVVGLSVRVFLKERGKSKGRNA